MVGEHVVYWLEVWQRRKVFYCGKIIDGFLVPSVPLNSWTVHALLNMILLVLYIHLDRHSLLVMLQCAVYEVALTGSTLSRLNHKGKKLLTCVA